MHYRTLGNSPDLYPFNANSTPPSLSFDNLKCLQTDCQMSVEFGMGRYNLPPAENHCHRKRHPNECEGLYSGYLQEGKNCCCLCSRVFEGSERDQVCEKSKYTQGVANRYLSLMLLLLH